MAESPGRLQRTKWAKRRTAYPGGRRGSRGPCSAGTASTGRLLRTPRVFTHTAGHTRPAVMGEDGKGRRSPQAMACRKRDVEERGRPPQLLHGGSDGRGSTALEGTAGETRRRHPAGTDVSRRTRGEEGGEGLATGTPTVCGWGVVSSVVLGGGESPPHGAGLDGSMPPGKDTHPGHGGPESSAPTSLRARAIRVLPCTDARATEEPDAGKLHVRVCTGGVG